MCFDLAIGSLLFAAFERSEGVSETVVNEKLTNNRYLLHFDLQLKFI